MIVVLDLDESVTIQFKDSDGSFTISFEPNRIIVEAELPDTQGREGIIYEEVFGAGIETSPVLDTEVDKEMAVFLHGAKKEKE